MAIFFTILSFICTYFSVEEYWNVVNIIPALILLGLSYTKIKKNNPLYAAAPIILIIKDITWWIMYVGVNFDSLATVMMITGALKMISDIAIIALSIVICFNKESIINKLLSMQIIFMSIRIILFVLPLIIYSSTYDNSYIGYISAGSYAFIFASYLSLMYKKNV